MENKTLLLLFSLFAFASLSLLVLNDHSTTGNSILSKCTDSDGITPTLQGVVTVSRYYDGDVTYTDSCLSNRVVTEWYCATTGAQSKPLSCATNQVCYNGACSNPAKLVTIQGKYTQFHQYPLSFFQGASLFISDIVKVTDRIYLLEVELSNKPVFNYNVKGTYDPSVYGSTTPEGFVLGTAAAPINNNGQHSWDVIAHELGHAFWASSNFYYTIAVPGPFLQEATAVLTAQYVYERIKADPQHFSLPSQAVTSLDTVFTEERAYQKKQYNEYIRLGKPYSQDESTPYAVLTSQALDYKMFLIGDTYGWTKYPRFYKAFSDDLKPQFTFWQDGVSNTEETTYTVAALSVAFNHDFRQEFKDLNFPVDDTLYAQFYPVISTHVNTP